MPLVPWRTDYYLFEEEEGVSKKKMKKKIEEEGVSKKKMNSRDIGDASRGSSSKEMLQSIPELMANLPTKVLTDILLRLPVEPLLRFRCVSKPWLALIDSPDFIKLHINRSIEAKNNHSLLVKLFPTLPVKKFPTYLINLDSLDVAVKIDLPLQAISGQRYPTLVVGSCNGLVLLSYEKYIGHADTIVIWNPFTKRYRRLPTALTESPHFPSDSETYGIGYDSVRDDYKVLKMNEWRNKDDNGFYSEVQIYSLKSNTLRRIQDFPYDLLDWCYGVFCGGALHWLVSDKHCESRCVAAFDLATEEYQLLLTPSSMEEFVFSETNLEVLDGWLCICHHRKESIDVWVMKNYGVGDSWTKLFSVSLPIDNMVYESFSPLALSKDGTQVLYMHNGNGLIWFDLESNSGKGIDVRGLPRRFGVEFVMQSLIPLGSGSQTYGTKQHREDKDSQPKKDLEEKFL